MQLELKHLAAYLPYGLKAMYNGIKFTITALGQKNCYGTTFESSQGLVFNDFKPILRPLSDIEDDEINTPEYLQSCCYSYVQYLLEQHYDVFGLIDNGLAIDVNTIR